MLVRTLIAPFAFILPLFFSPACTPSKELPTRNNTERLTAKVRASTALKGVLYSVTFGDTAIIEASTGRNAYKLESGIGGLLHMCPSGNELLVVVTTGVKPSEQPTFRFEYLTQNDDRTLKLSRKMEGVPGIPLAALHNSGRDFIFAAVADTAATAGTDSVRTLYVLSDQAIAESHELAGAALSGNVAVFLLKDGSAVLTTRSQPRRVTIPKQFLQGEFLKEIAYDSESIYLFYQGKLVSVIDGEVNDLETLQGSNSMFNIGEQAFLSKETQYGRSVYSLVPSGPPREFMEFPVLQGYEFHSRKFLEKGFVELYRQPQVPKSLIVAVDVKKRTVKHYQVDDSVTEAQLDVSGSNIRLIERNAIRVIGPW